MKVLGGNHHRYFNSSIEKTFESTMTTTMFIGCGDGQEEESATTATANTTTATTTATATATTTTTPVPAAATTTAAAGPSGPSEPEEPPPVIISKKKVDELLASKLNNMSLEERDNGLYDLHGVADNKELVEIETPTMIQEKISKMNEILDGMTFPSLFPDEQNNEHHPSCCEASPHPSFCEAEASPLTSSNNTFHSHSHSSSLIHNPNSHLMMNNKQHQQKEKEQQQQQQQRQDETQTQTPPVDAYQIACLLSQEYVDKMKILCLRAEDYDCYKSSQLLVRHFHRKMELFGPDCLARDLCQHEDFTQYDDEFHNSLRGGLIQILPNRDTAGRAIKFVDGKVNVKCKSTLSAARIHFYMTMCALQDLETQRKGVVIIYYGIDQGKGTYIPGRIQEYVANLKSMPFKIPAWHHCLDNNSQNTGVAFSLKHCLESIVCRTRLHTGTDAECLYNLCTYCIPKQTLPVLPDGSRRLSSHHEMLDTLKAVEMYRHNHIDQQQTTPPKQIVLIPRPKDVLLGQGRLPKSHPGNLRMRNLIEDRRQEHESSRRHQKTEITKKILQTMKDDGSKFLAPDHNQLGGAFVECTDTVAREKIAHGFRNLRIDKVKKKKQQQQKRLNKTTNKKNKLINNNNNDNNDNVCFSHEKKRTKQ